MLAHFQNFCWLKNSSIIFEWMLHHSIDHKMILYINYFLHFILLTLRTIQDALIMHFYNSLEYIFFIFRNNFFSIMQLKLHNDVWGGFFWKSIWLNKIFSFGNLKISFTEIFNDRFKKEFKWNLMLRYTVKLMLH